MVWFLAMDDLGDLCCEHLTFVLQDDSLEGLLASS